MPAGRIIGPADQTNAAGGSAANFFQGCRYQALATGQITEFKVKVKTGGNIKIAIYADSAGEPGARLWHNSTGQACTTGWNTFTVSPALSITKDVFYWLMFNNDTSDFVANFSATSGTLRYKTATYSTFTFPDPAGTGFSSEAVTRFLAGWGILILSPDGIAQDIVYGTPKLNFTLYPSGIEQALAYGTPTVQIAGTFIYPSGIEQVVAQGNPTLIQQQFLSPSGIEQQLAYGTPALIYPQTLSPSGIEQLIVIGTPSVGIGGLIGPVGIEQVIAIGSPQVLKYVWHVILDGQYATETPDINRAYIIGRDIHGNPVYGTAIDSTELGLVGERLDFKLDLSIPTDTMAGEVASAVLQKMRLTKARGFILIPPNCGQELWDVVQVTDAGANQAEIKFRVVGIRFEYNPKQARYEHKLILGAP